MKKEKTKPEEVATAPGADVETAEPLKVWENTDPNVVRSGTACKCGAHTSAVWEKGGREWLAGHVAEVHAEAFDWPAAIRKALEMPDALDALSYLATLVKHEETKESLADA